MQLIRPRRWSLPPAPQRAREARSDTPLDLRLIPLPGIGPEDVVVDAAGRVVTGLADGRILRVHPESGSWEQIADTRGRPLGLEPLPDGGLLICDSRRGLLRADPDGELEVLADTVDGTRLRFASNVVQAPDRTIWFSESTRRFDLEHYRGDLLEHSGTGRLFRLRPGGEPETVLDGLQFANGVVLAPDGSCVVVAETAGYRITRHWLTGPRAGTADRLVENLPGFPDNMALGSDGLLWVSLPTSRNPVLDRLLPLPGVLRALAWVVPERLQPSPAATAWAIALNWAGEMVHDRQAPSADCGFSMVTSAVERDGTVYLGSLHEAAIAVFEV